MNSATPGTVTTSDAEVVLQQKFFSENLDEAEKRRRRYYWESTSRRGAAYALKAISIFGAIVVAAKIGVIDQTALGLTIAGAVGADQLTSNHLRLISLVAGRYATERLLAKMKLEHMRGLPEVLSLRAGGKLAEANAKLSTLVAALNVSLQEGMEMIADAVRDVDLKALNNLYLDVRSQ